MKTIYKYPLEVANRQIINLPEGANILNVLNQNEVPVLYAEVDTEEKEIEKVEIAMVGTGHPIDEIEEYEYITSVLFKEGKFISHFYHK